ncbi:uncharacterized protein GGS25DRAFT_531312 [Hypoxylon fragiforme]|uniref:uncharacterized protein n=1 Tax=Hypoxylon fragiforme TaxID=63214 RepID=UPI0020C6520B|nr:uncharacterized protein GGS25DRAFT_531312 [Hypoxylon fragiforme]KAI2608095.1 hypothetical protein GGS25DRAFT_531312 [Hypoxylon fragiforme]
MKRSMAGCSEGPASKKARTAESPMNPPTNNTVANATTHNDDASAQLQKLRARVAELEDINREFTGMLPEYLKETEQQLASVKEAINETRDNNAKLQGEIAAIKKPRRQTNLRKDIQQAQERAEGLEGEIQAAKNENTELQAAAANAEREKDYWKEPQARPSSASQQVPVAPAYRSPESEDHELATETVEAPAENVLESSGLNGEQDLSQFFDFDAASGVPNEEIPEFNPAN